MSGVDPRDPNLVWSLFGAVVHGADESLQAWRQHGRLLDETSALWLDLDGFVTRGPPDVLQHVLELRRIADLIWSGRAHVSVLSRAMTLAPGDIVMTGTPAGVSAVVAGDVITGGVEGIGELEVTIGDRA